MKKGVLMRKLTIFLSIIFIGLFIMQCTKKPANVDAPIAKKQPKELTIHEDTRIDNYFWMNQRENEEVIAYLNAENDYKDKMMAHTEKLQKKLYKEIVGRIKQDDESVPYKDNDFYYYRRFEEGGEYPIYARKHADLTHDEEILLNVNENGGRIRILSS